MLNVINTIKTVQGFLTPQHIAQRIAAQKPINQAIRNWIFTNAVQHQLAHIATSELQQVIQNVPVVRRGTAAYNVGGNGQSVSLIEPQGIDIIDSISATDINNMRLMSTSSIQQIVNQKTDRMMKIVSKSAEALCAQSLTGQISYQMKTESGMDTYEVSFGETLKYTVPTKWDSSEATIVKIFSDLTNMKSAIEEQGFGTKVEFKAGKNAYNGLLAIAEKTNSKTIKVEIKESTVYVGGIAVTMESSTYIGANKKPIKKVPDHQIVAVDVDAGHGFWWLALDDFDAGLVALPFFPSQEVIKNPSQMNIIGRSKPLPGPVVKSICWADVVAEPAP